MLAFVASLLLLTTGAAAQSVFLQAESQINLHDSNVALTQFASLFIRDLMAIESEPLLSVALDNSANDQALEGSFRLSLTHNGAEVGWFETAPIEIAAKTRVVWELKTGFSADLLVDLISAIQDEDVDPSEILGDHDLGNIAEWEIVDSSVDEQWVKESIFDYEGIGELDGSGVVDLVEQLRSVQFPSGNYAVNVRFNYKEIPSGTTGTVQTSIAWAFTNPDAVRLVSPRSDAPGFPRSGVPESELAFTWTLPELPDTFAATSRLRVVDRATGRVVLDQSIVHDAFDYNADYTYGDSPDESLAEIQTGRLYEWSVNLTGPLGRTIGGNVPTATFWVDNQAPVIENIDLSNDAPIEGDTVTLTASYSDDGDDVRSLRVQWFVNDQLYATNQSQIRLSFQDSLAGDAVYSVRLDVTDSFDETTSAIVDIPVAQNQPPVVEIDTIDEDGPFKLGAFIELNAVAEDPEGEGLRRLEWFVNSANALGDGQRIGAGASLRHRLDAEGERRFTLVVEDVRGAVSRDDIVLDVRANQAPVVVIESPTPGSYEEGSELQLVASATDDFDGDLSVAWEINGVRFNDDVWVVPEGIRPYDIRAFAVDSDGAVGEDRVVVAGLVAALAPPPADPDEPALPAPPQIALSAPDQIRIGESASATAAIAADGDVADIAWLIGGVEAPASALSVDGSELSLDGLGLGRHRIVVMAIDSFGQTATAAATVQVVANQAPTFDVSGLAAAYVAGDEVQAVAIAQDPDGDGVASVAWQAVGPDGQVRASGDGETIAFVADIAGSYSLRLEATDNLGAVGRQAIAVAVRPNAPPVLEIVQPQAGAVLVQGEPVSVSVRAVDPDGDAIASFALDGAEDAAVAGDVATFTRTFEQVGPAVLTFTATDSRGAAASRTVGVIVVQSAPAAPAAPLQVTLVLPEIDGPMPFGSPQRLQAEVSGSAADTAMVSWLVGGEVVGASSEASDYAVEHAFAQEGSVQVEAIAVDAFGAQGRAMTTVSVAANQPPTVAVAQPSANAELPYGQPVTLAADVVDPEGHAIDVVWLLDDQPVASGNPVVAALTQPGTRRLTARAVDAYGLASEATLAVTISAPEGEALPPMIVEPVANQVVTAGQAVSFVSANVPEGSAVVWRSSVIGELQGESSRSESSAALVTTLPEGEHIVALIVDQIQRDQVTVLSISPESAQSAAAQPVALVESFAAALDAAGARGVEIATGPADSLQRAYFLTSPNDIGLEILSGQAVLLDPGESISVIFYDATISAAPVTYAQPASAQAPLLIRFTEEGGVVETPPQAN